jgi:hypothetical protein
VNEFSVGPVTDTNAAANTVAEDAPVGTVVGITAFASDADATTNSITYALDDAAGGRFAINSLTGVVTVAGALDYETSTSHSITVRATSADGTFSTQSFVINVANVNEAPVASPDFYLLRQSISLSLMGVNGLLANDFDVDGDPLSIILISGPAHGTLICLSDGSLKYLAANNFYGADSFSYQVTDGLLTSSIVSVTIDVMQIIAPGNWDSSLDRGNSNRDTSGDHSIADSTTGFAYSTAIALANSGLGNSLSSLTRQGVRETSAAKDSNEIVSQATSTGEGQVNLMEAVSWSGTEFGTSLLFGLTGSSRGLSADRILTNLIGGSLPTAGSLDAMVSEGFFTLSKATAATSPSDPSSPSALADQVLVGSTTVVTTSLSVGYVIWLLRGGSLLTAFMSAMPTWQSFDPLPVLQSFEKSQEEDEESLLGIVTKKIEKRIRG